MNEEKLWLDAEIDKLKDDPEFLKEGIKVIQAENDELRKENDYLKCEVLKGDDKIYELRKELAELKAKEESRITLAKMLPDYCGLIDFRRSANINICIDALEQVILALRKAGVE